MKERGIPKKSVRYALHHSLRRQLTVLVAASLATLLLVQALCLVWFANLTQKRAFHYAQDSLGLISGQITAMFEDMERLVFNVSFSQSIQEYLTTSDLQRKYVVLYPLLSEMIRNMSASNNNIYDIMFFGAQGTVALSLQQAHSLSVYERVQMPENEMQLSETTALPAVLYGNSIYYPFARAVYGTSVQSGFMDRIGTCLVLCDGETVQGLVDGIRIAENAQLFVVDRYGTIIASNHREQLGTEFDAARYGRVRGDVQTRMEDGEEYIIQHAEAGDWQVFSIVPVHSLLSDMRRVMLLCTLVVSLAACFLLLTGVSISRHINKSVARIVRFMKEVTAGQREKRFTLKDMDEITAIAESTNQMLDQMEETHQSMLQAQSELYEAKLLERQAQFMALQRQINPHFLFNTLNCIASLAAVRDVPEIVQIASSMGQIFRYCIKGADVVPLREEIEVVRRYLEIIQLRYRGKIRGVIDVAEDLLDERMPKMILQPIVENAVFHGLEPKREGGRIVIRGRRCAQGMLVFEIEDDGKGFDASVIEQLRKRLQSCAETAVGTTEEKASRGSVGLVNIAARIRFLLGEQARVEVRSQPERGACVTVYIPPIGGEAGEA